MAINIYIATRDLVTALPISSQLKDIESDHNFFLFKKRAAQKGCFFIPTIDAYGDTVFNELQLKFVEQEIKLLRDDEHIDQTIVSALQTAIDAAKILSSHYVVFIGD